MTTNQVTLCGEILAVFSEIHKNSKMFCVGRMRNFLS